MNREDEKKELFILTAAFLLLAAAAALAYSNTLNAPFVFDDGANILENPHIRMTSLSLPELAHIFKTRSPRLFAYLTFEINYCLHGYNVTGYHLTNIAIHILAGILLFLIARKTIALAGSQNEGTLASFFAALLFLLAPVHTQAVTYIVQRMASMAAMFCLLSLFLYIKARFKQREGRIKSAAILFVLSALSWLLALGSKQIAAILPVMALLYEWYFFQDLDGQWIKRKIGWIAGGFIVIAAVAALFLGRSPIDKILSMYDKQSFTMGERLLTEPRVIFLYLSLLLYPNPSRLNVDYDFPVSTSLFSPPTTILSIIGILALIIVAVLTAKKHRLFSFAILWFLGCLAIESSFLGLALVFEHRVYMPSAFIFVWLAFFVLKTLNPRPLAIAILCIACAISGFWTYKRNSVWVDDVALWQDVVKKSPNNARAYNNLGLVWHKKNEIDKAIESYKNAINLAPQYINAYNSMGFAFLDIGKMDEAEKIFRKILDIDPADEKAWNNLGIVMMQTGRTKEAVQYYNRCLAINPYYTKAYSNLGLTSLYAGDQQKALEFFKKAVSIDPYYDYAKKNIDFICENLQRYGPVIASLEESLSKKPNDPILAFQLGRFYQVSGMRDKAIAQYEKAISISPDFKECLNSLGAMYAEIYRLDNAIECYEKLALLSPGNPKVFYNLACLYSRAGKKDKAVENLQKALELGYDDIEHIKNDHDLDNIRGTHLYRSLIGKRETDGD